MVNWFRGIILGLALMCTVVFTDLEKEKYDEVYSAF